MLKSLARDDGVRFLPQSPHDLLVACERIARIRNGYTIGYTPPARDGAFHRVRVVVQTTTSLNVRTRPGYFAGRGAER